MEFEKQQEELKSTDNSRENLEIGKAQVKKSGLESPLIQSDVCYSIFRQFNTKICHSEKFLILK